MRTLFTGMFCLVFLNNYAYSEEQIANNFSIPQIFIQKQADKASSILLNPSLEHDNKIQEMNNLFYEAFEPELLCGKVYGRSKWNRNSPQEEKDRLCEVVRDIIVSVLTFQFAEYASWRIEFVSQKGDGSIVQVEGMLISPENEEMGISWALKCSDMQCRFIDITVASIVSLVDQVKNELRRNSTGNTR